MKKLRLLPLLVLMLLCLYAAALADIPSEQLQISYITDASGYVSTLTDNNTATVWTMNSYTGADLTIGLYGGSVGEIWIRNGHAYSTNYYNHFDRPATVKVTVHYYANQYTTSYDTYRYQLTDAYRPNVVSKSWDNGYQRLLLPKKYNAVTQIELTIESVIGGYGQTGATISDIIVAEGSHATATPRSYATATPRPYKAYVTATPDPNAEDDDEPLVEYITPKPKKTPTPTPLVEVITPRPTATATPKIQVITARPTTPQVEVITPKPKQTPTATPQVEVITPKPKQTPTATPLVEVITPKPIVTAAPDEYPTEGGVIAHSTQRLSTRSGPGTRFDEPGTFFGADTPVNVLTKVYDEYNNVWWFQIEFEYKNLWYRVYTTESRLDIDRDQIPDEPDINDPLDTRKALQKCYVSFGPGEEYAVFTQSVIHPGNKLDVYAIEDDWVQIEYTDYGSSADPLPKRRGWVPIEVVYDENN